MPLSCVLEAMLLHPPIERATAEPQCFGSLAHIALKTLKSFANEKRLDGLEVEFLEIVGLRTLEIKPEVGRLNLVSVTHQHRAFKRVIELASHFIS